LERFGMRSCQPVATPVESSLTTEVRPPTSDEQQSMVDIPYAQAVGTLTYLSITS
ncbi:hypothetical protein CAUPRSCDRAFT_2539, partial [Caulochytrium protostelioides]